MTRLSCTEPTGRRDQNTRICRRATNDFVTERTKNYEEMRFIYEERSSLRSWVFVIHRVYHLDRFGYSVSVCVTKMVVMAKSELWVRNRACCNGKEHVFRDNF